MFTYKFVAEINNSWCEGSFVVKSENYSDAYNAAMNIISDYLAGLPGTLRAEYDVDCIKSNAAEVFEGKLKEAIAKCGEDHIDIIYDSEEDAVIVMYHSDNNSFSHFKAYADEFLFEENDIDTIEDYIGDTAFKYGVGYTL